MCTSCLREDGCTGRYKTNLKGPLYPFCLVSLLSAMFGCWRGVRHNCHNVLARSKSRAARLVFFRRIRYTTDKSTSMPLFSHTHKTTTLSRDAFTPLGQSWPIADASTVEGFKANVRYFQSELVRLRDSIAWINDDPMNRNAQVGNLLRRSLLPAGPPDI